MLAAPPTSPPGAPPERHVAPAGRSQPRARGCAAPLRCNQSGRPGLRGPFPPEEVEVGHRSCPMPPRLWRIYSQLGCAAPLQEASFGPLKLRGAPLGSPTITHEVARCPLRGTSTDSREVARRPLDVTWVHREVAPGPSGITSPPPSRPQILSARPSLWITLQILCAAGS